MQRRRLAAAGLADQAERLALADVEADAVDRAHGADLALEDRALHAAGSGVTRSVEPRARPRAPRAGSARPAASGRSGSREDVGRPSARPPRSRRRGWQAARWSGLPTGDRAPARPRGRRRCASGQRGANGQPGGRSTSDGGLPSIGDERPRRPARRARGIEPSRPIVYGIRGAVEDLVDRARLDDPPGVHDRDPVGEAGDHAEVVGDHDDRRAGHLAARCCSTSRTCAWIVTSSAVVGSSAMITSGSLAIAIAIITRWRMPPENSCGKAVGALPRRSGCRPGRAARPRARAPRPCDDVVVDADRLGDLVADGVDRGQRRQRVLEDHRDAACRGCRDSSSSPRPSSSCPSSRTEPVTSRVVGQQAHDRQRRRPTCPSRTRRRCRAPRRARARRSTPRTARHVAAVGRGTSTVQVADGAGRGVGASRLATPGRSGRARRAGRRRPG